MWTGLRSSDGEVSKRITFWQKGNVFTGVVYRVLTFARVHVYIARVERLYSTRGAVI